MSSSSFKTIPLAERKELFYKLRNKYPNEFPVICEKMEGSEAVLDNKYMVPKNIYVGQLIDVFLEKKSEQKILFSGELFC